MWIFGQVWFACLVGFAVGVVLDWVVRVRPLNSRVADLEARLADARSGSNSELGGSVFDRGAFATENGDSTGFVTERNRGGLLTPRARGGVATHLLESGQPLDDNQPTEVRSGVEDFPGVSRLSGAWETEAEEAANAAPAPPEPWHQAEEPWQQSTPAAAEESWMTAPQADQPWQQEPEAVSMQAPSMQEPAQESWQETARQPDEDSWLTEPNQAAEQPVAEAEPGAEADQQYLEFLRAGANHAPAQPDVDDVDENEITNAGEVAEPGSSEVTSVLPYALTEDGQPQVEGYGAYETYAQDDYQQNGYQQDEFQQNGYQESYQDSAYQDAGYDIGSRFGEYQSEQVDEPAESSTPLPRRTSGEGSMRFAPFAPFEIPFEPTEAEPVDVRPHNGELTPIEEGGFQPFEKPPGSPEVPYDANTDGAWMADDGQLVGMHNGADSSPMAANGTHMLAGQDEPGGSSWFDFSDMARAGAENTSLTQRMLPVSRPDLDHPDLLQESVFGTDNDTIYDEDAPARSLFEPVIAPDELEDDYRAPAHEAQVEYEQPYTPESDYQQPETEYQADYQPETEYQQPEYDQPEYDQPGPTETTEEFPAQAPAPRPVRVRTGVDGPATQSIPAMSPVPQPDSRDGSQVDTDDDGTAAGPFGPGSALPLPDGSAPAPQFRIKARTSSMVFHTESSPFYERLEPQVWFRDQEDAQRAGFTSWERPRAW